MSRSAALAALACLLLATAACDKVPLLAPTQSTITLTVNTTTVPVAGTAEVIASVTEQAGTPAQNGTVVTFTSSFGTIEPSEARTEGGKAKVIFRAGNQSGVARIGAFSGATRATEVEVRVGGAAAERVAVRAEPASVPVTGGTVQIIAVVTDASGNPLPGAPTVFTTDNGNLSSNTAVSDANGQARVSLTTTRESVVRANVAGKEGQVTVRVVSLPTLTITANTQTPLVGVPVSFTLTPTSTTGSSAIQNVTVDFGDGTAPRTLGAITGATGVSHTFTVAGTYTVTATLRDITGQTSASSIVVVVQRSQPTVTLTATPTSVTAGGSVTFSVNAQPATGGPAIRDVVVTQGGAVIFTGGPGSSTFTRQFTTTGTFTVQATATDLAGTSATATTTVVVTARPVIEMTLDAAAADPILVVSCVPLATYPKTCTTTLVGFGARVQFTAGFVGTAPTDVTGYVWNFGDGSSETTLSRSTDRVYTIRGTYTVTVTVQTVSGATGTQRLTLIVL